MESTSKSQRQINNNTAPPDNHILNSNHDDVGESIICHFQFLTKFNLQEKFFDPGHCPSTECSRLQFPCIKCTYNMSCIYGEQSIANCEAKDKVDCSGSRTFNRYFQCRYCFLTERWEHDCMQKTSCKPTSAIHKTNCTVHPEIFCLGNRQFSKKVRCNWSRGGKWFTAMVLSITLGGFGVDRFYLGHWQEGIGKLFSFGGLGVWVIVDAILISIGFLGSSSDGSLLL